MEEASYTSYACLFEGCVGLGSIGFRLGASHEGLRVRHYWCETRPFHERGAERGGTDIGLIARLGCVPPHRRIAQSYLSALYAEQTSPRVRSLICFYKAVRLDVGAHTRRRAVSCCPVSVMVQPNLFDLYCREVARNHLGQPAWAYPGQHRVPAFSVPLIPLDVAVVVTSCGKTELAMRTLRALTTVCLADSLPVPLDVRHACLHDTHDSSNEVGA